MSVIFTLNRRQAIVLCGGEEVLDVLCLAPGPRGHLAFLGNGAQFRLAPGEEGKAKPDLFKVMGPKKEGSGDREVNEIIVSFENGGRCWLS
jgi:hypothetical protein